MINASFRIAINAPKEKVWQALWQDEHYRKWTSVFHEGSYMVTDGKEGDKVHFLGPDGSGMYSVIARMIPNEFMSFRHLGIVRNGEEEPASGTESWVGATENYTLDETAGTTLLVADIDVEEREASYFQDIFPKALALVKEISEAL